jgi:crotonobetainyl-CoA:carnitine CoA-transferase CaiB-like acyl-CoA transferase
MSINGTKDGPPLMVGAAVVDTATMHVAVEAVLAALYKRERTGTGDHIEVSLLEVAMSLQTYHWGVYLQGGSEPTRNGNGTPWNAPAADLVTTMDGHVVLSAYIAEHWIRLCEVLDRREWLTDPRFVNSASRVANREAMLAELNKSLGCYKTQDVISLLSRAGLVVAAVRTYSQARHDDDVAASGIIQATSTVDGAHYETLGLPFRFASAERRRPAPAPRAGRDTLAVLAELGFTESEQAQLVAEQIVSR